MSDVGGEAREGRGGGTVSLSMKTGCRKGRRTDGGVKEGVTTRGLL